MNAIEEKFAKACREGDEAFVNIYLQKTDPNIEVLGNGLISASAAGHVNIVSILLENQNFDPGISRNEALIQAVSILLENQNLDLGISRNEALIQAIEKKYLEVIELLLKDPRVNPADRENQALYLAVRGRHVPLVGLLLRQATVTAQDLDELFANAVNSAVLEENTNDFVENRMNSATALKMALEMVKLFLRVEKVGFHLHLSEDIPDAILTEILKKRVEKKLDGRLCEICHKKLLVRP